MVLLNTLVIEQWQLILGIMVFLTGIFGSPFIARSVQREQINKKLDKTEIIEVKCEINKKANLIYVDREIDRVNSSMRDHEQKNNEQFKSINENLNQILTILINMKK